MPAMQAVAVLTNGVMSTSRADSQLLRHFSLPVSHYLSTAPRAFGSTGEGGVLPKNLQITLSLCLGH